MKSLFIFIGSFVITAIIAIYSSISDAAKSVGVKQPSNICSCCRKVYGKKTIAGFRWEYVGE